VNKDVEVSFDIENVGNVKGDAVAQLYIKDIVSSVTTYDSELRGFERVTLQPGEKKKIRFTLHPEALALLDKNMKWTVEPGEFKAMIGNSSADIKLSKIFTMQ
jgi:beta-glucosidase